MLQIEGLRSQLSYQEVLDATKWPHIMITDYLGITTVNNSLRDAIEVNEVDVDDITTEIAALAEENGILRAELNDLEQKFNDLEQLTYVD